MAIMRLQNIKDDGTSYTDLFKEAISRCDFAWVGGPANLEKIHTNVVVPYISSLLQNIEKRFGDSSGKISIAATIFDPNNISDNISQQLDKVRLLSEYFKMDCEAAVAEWTCFRSFLSKHQEMSTVAVLKSVLTSSLGDAFPLVAKIAGIILACPVGTAGKLNKV